MQKLEATILDMLDQSARNIKTTPLNLGGVGGTGGGVGVPPGGFIGRLPQWAVAYDTLEAATLDTLPSGVTGASGWSLVDNLNHIRYRLDIIESGGSICVIDDDTVTSYPDTTHLHFSGAGVVINDLGGGHIQAVITATGSGGGGGLDETTANGLYLRLDTANNPLTNGLDIIPTTDLYGMYVETAGDKTILDLEQYANGVAVSSDFIFGYQEADDLNVTSIFLDGVRWRSGAGAFSGNWIHFEENNVALFDVDNDGNAYTQGELLIRDAPSTSIHYVRRNAAWVGIIPYHDFNWYYGASTNTTTNPGNGQFVTNNATDSLVTEMALNVNTDTNQQLDQYGNMLYSGDMVLVQQISDARYWSRYQVNGSVIDNTSWHRIPVQHVLSSDIGTPARDENTYVTFEFLAPVIGSGGGGGGIEEAPIDGTPYVRQDADWVTASGWGFGSNFRHIDQSGGTSDTYGVLAGAINGSNAVFTVSQAMYLTGSLEVYLNGQLQTQGSAEDWVETSPAAGTFTFNTAPSTGDLITVAYLKVNTATGNADTLDGFDSLAFVQKAAMSGRVWLPFASYNIAAGITTTSIIFIATVDRTFNFVQWSQALRVNATNNGSNYWDLTLNRMDGTLLNTISTSAQSANTWLNLNDTSFALSSVSSSDVGLYIAAIKTGAPGFIDLGQPLIEGSV